MALSLAAQRKALEALKYPKEKIDEILGEGEHDPDLPQLHIYDKTGLDELQSNLRKGYEKDYPEIWCRQMNKEHELGLTGDAAKDPKKIVEAMKAKAIKEAGITPGEWESKFKELQGNYGEKDKEVAEYKRQLQALQSERTYRSLFFPTMSDALDEDEWIARLQKHFEIEKDGEILGLKLKSTGKFVCDETMNVIPYKDAFAKEIAKDQYKTWHKAKQADPPPPPGNKPTHDPAHPNPALQKQKKFKSQEEIMKEVDKKYPPDKKMPNKAALRNAYFRELSLQNAE